MTAHKGPREANFKKRVTIKGPEAFTRWLDAKQPPLRAFAAMLQAEGHSISYITLSRYARKLPQWNVLAQPPNGNTASRIISIIDQLNAEASRIGGATFTGLQARMISRIAEMLDKGGKYEIVSADELLKTIEAIERLRSLAHNVRGDEKSDAPAQSMPIGAAGNRPRLADLASGSTPAPDLPPVRPARPKLV